MGDTAGGEQQQQQQQPQPEPKRKRRRRKKRGQQEWAMEKLVEVRELPPEEGKKMKRTEYRGTALHLEPVG